MFTIRPLAEKKILLDDLENSLEILEIKDENDRKGQCTTRSFVCFYSICRCWKTE